MTQLKRPVMKVIAQSRRKGQMKILRDRQMRTFRQRIVLPQLHKFSLGVIVGYVHVHV